MKRPKEKQVCCVFRKHTCFSFVYAIRLLLLFFQILLVVVSVINGNFVGSVEYDGHVVELVFIVQLVDEGGHLAGCVVLS